MLYVLSTVFGLVLGVVMVMFFTEPRRRSARADRVSAEAAVAQALREAEQVKRDRDELKREREVLADRQRSFDGRIITAESLERESAVLKRDLANMDVVFKKLHMDKVMQAEEQARLDERSKELAERYLADVEKSVGERISANNYAACKQRLVRAIEWCRNIGFGVPAEREASLMDQLRADFELEVRRQVEREEQSRIKAQIREEEKLSRELEKERLAAERERAIIQEALARAMAQTQDVHGAEIQRLQSRLADAEAKVRERTISQAELTKAGHIYVISNLGSFGDGIVKIGMTRRLEPAERISELGDASVPFPFDVHMLISCPDAPALENALHREFQKRRVNRVNPRKEYFRVGLEEIRRFVEAKHGEVRFTADAEASQYRQSLAMSDDDQEIIDSAFAKADMASGVSYLDD